MIHHCKLFNNSKKKCVPPNGNYWHGSVMCLNLELNQQISIGTHKNTFSSTKTLFSTPQFNLCSIVQKESLRFLSFSMLKRGEEKESDRYSEIHIQRIVQ